MKPQDLKKTPWLEPSHVATELRKSGGMSEYRTRDGVEVLMVHYSASERRSPFTPQGAEWIRKALAKGYVGGMDGIRWMQEMEMSHDVRLATRVWPDFNESYRPAIVEDPFEPDESWPIYVGYDYGTTNPCAFVAVAWESETRLHMFDEIYRSGLNVFEQFELLRSRPYFQRINGIIGDPSIWNRTQNVQSGNTMLLMSLGEMIQDNFDIYVLRGDNSPGTDISFIHYLNGVLWKSLESPLLTITSNCVSTLRELRQLRYREWKTEAVAQDNSNYETIVQKDNHAWDALKYLLLWRQNESPTEPEAPVESFEWYRNQLIQMKKQQQKVLA